MNRKHLTVVLMLLIPLVFTTGCWDRRELNERAFAMATGLDRTKGGMLVQSYQFALPAKLGGPTESRGDKAYQIYETKGKTLQEARQTAQAELSRQIFLGHRRAILIGEDMARHGLRNVLDVYSRNPEARLRTDMFVIQGGEARTELAQDYPFERLPALAYLRIHKETGGHPGDTSFRDFLMDATSDANCPSLLSMSNNKVTGRAIFNRKLQLVGFLVKNEAADRLWLTGGITHFVYTVYIPQSHGKVAFDVHRFHHKIRPIIHGNHVSFLVDVYGTADIKENDASLDLLRPTDTKVLEQAFQKYEGQQISHMVHRVQIEYGTDVFRFGEVVHRRYPVQWRQLKQNWSSEFARADVHVTVHIKVQRTGVTGTPLQLPPDLKSGV